MELPATVSISVWLECLICFVDLTIAGLGIASEIGCFDIDRVNGLLVGSKFEFNGSVTWKHGNADRFNDLATWQHLLSCWNRCLTPTLLVNSVTATVIDLYVCWKPGFMLKLEAWLSVVEVKGTVRLDNRLGLNGLVLDSDVTVATLNTGPNTYFV